MGTIASGNVNRGSAHADEHAGSDGELLSCCSKDGYTARPDAHGPMGVLFNHMHREGEWMVGISHMSMHMDGLRDRTSSITPAQNNAKGFPVSPTEMDMDMTMIHSMYAPSDDLTVMLMVPWVENRMNHVTGTGVRFKTEAEGLGDVTVGGMFRVHEEDNEHVHVQLGLSLPTGGIDKKDVTPASAGKGVILPYPMQLGTGTYDLMPGVTYSAASEHWSWGAQAQLRFHLSRNSNHYARGTSANVTGWVAHALDESASVSLRVAHSIRNDIRGDDPDLSPTIVPTADASRQGGERTDVFLGMNLQGTEGAFTGHRFSFEFGLPVYQRLHGPQLEVDRTLTLGWQKGF